MRERVRQRERGKGLDPGDNKQKVGPLGTHIKVQIFFLKEKYLAQGANSRVPYLFRKIRDMLFHCLQCRSPWTCFCNNFDQGGCLSLASKIKFSRCKIRN